MAEHRAGAGRGPGRGHMHGPGAMMPGEKAGDFKGSMGKLIRHMKSYRVGFLIVLLFAVGGTAFNIVGPKILSLATTEIFEGLMRKVSGSGGIDFSKIADILSFLLLIYLVSGLLTFLQGWIMNGIAQKFCYQLRQEIAVKINHMPMKYFESRTVGEVLSRITNDVDTLGQSLNQSITQLITSVTTIIGVFFMMLSISPLMTGIALVILPVSGLMIGIVIKFSQKYFVDQQKYLGSLNGQIEEVYSGHNIVKLFNREEQCLEEFHEINEKLGETAWKAQFLSGMMHPVMMFVGNLGYVAVAVSGSFLAVRQVIAVGDIQAFIQYVRNFTQPITTAAQVSGMLQSMAAAAERVFEFLEEEEEDDQGSLTATERVKGSVSFEHVHFGYQEDRMIIHDFNSRIEPGQMVAIVGPTGAGKTTMVKLLMRFYDVNQGCIKVDDQDIRVFSRADLRKNFGMVLQDTWLFRGTIMENIRYGRPGASDEEVIAAAKAAHADHFIRTLPGGYQMELNEEAGNVSQGQRQLLTIARAILSDSPIMILDEATSSVDTRTEAKIQEAMANLMRGRTSFVIAHRLSTIRDADLILVMKDGDIVEQGDHHSLLEKGGFYAELYQSQFDPLSEGG